MNNKENLTLIDGTFNPTDAQELLLNVFSTKIQFHNLKNFSAKERFGKEDKASSLRISQLRTDIEKVLAIIADAKVNNKILHISSVIQISMS